MKTRTVLFAALTLIIVTGHAQAQCTIQTTTNYSVSYSGAVNSNGTDILTSVLLDGNSTMQMIATGNCPDSIITAFNNGKQNIEHWPSVQNQIGSVGGWSQGPAVCAECYASYQTNTDSGPVDPGTQLPFTYNGQTYCGTAGIVFFTGLSDFLAWEIAYTRSINTGNKVATFVLNGQNWNSWSILYYCNPATSPPDWNPLVYNALAIYPPSSIFYVDGVAACVRINVTGAPWFCTPGGSIGWPQSSNLSQAACTHNP